MTVTSEPGAAQRLTFDERDSGEMADVQATAAHDLGNHLQVIYSAIELLQRSTDGEMRDALSVIFSGARSSLEQAIRLSRRIANAGECHLDGECRTSIAERLAALRDVLLLATGPAVLVEFDVREDVPDILCTAGDFDNAILNVVVNARRAMPRGGRLRITAGIEPQTGETASAVVLRVADTGCGMSAETLAKAFEPRFTTRAASEGSGIGLAMVATFAKSVGGSVNLESHLGVGTVVTIRLPAMLKLARAPIDQSLRRCTGD